MKKYLFAGLILILTTTCVFAKQYVGQANKVMKTDASGFVGWRDDADSADLGTIVSVYLYVYAQGVAETNFDTFIDATNTGLGPPTSWAWVNIDVSGTLTTWTLINAATTYFDKPNTTNDPSVDAAYLLVTYTPAATGRTRRMF